MKKEIMKDILIIIFLLFTLSFSCSAEQENIIVKDEYIDKSYSEMIEILGPPAHKTSYTIKDAPTKSWNHGDIFSKYPKIPENENVQIVEVAWDADNFRIHACFHMVNGVNRCLVAKKINKAVRF